MQLQRVIRINNMQFVAKHTGQIFAIAVPSNRSKAADVYIAVREEETIVAAWPWPGKLTSDGTVTACCCRTTPRAAARRHRVLIQRGPMSSSSAAQAN